MKQGHFEQVDQFDNSMKEVIKRENYRLEMQELAKQDVVKNAGQKASYFVGSAANKEFQERAKDEVYKEEMERAQQELLMDQKMKR